MAFIDGQKVVEGQKLEGGFVVESITRKASSSPTAPGGSSCAPRLNTYAAPSRWPGAGAPSADALTAEM